MAPLSRISQEAPEGGGDGRARVEGGSKRDVCEENHDAASAVGGNGEKNGKALCCCCVFEETQQLE